MSLLDTVKSSLRDIVEETRKGNTDFSNELLNRLFILLDDEISKQVNFTSIHSAINDINAHLQVISSRHRAEATLFYQAIKNSTLKDALIGFQSIHLRALSTEDFPLACKCLFQQIESCVNYLIQTSNLIEIIAKDPLKQSKYEYEQKGDRYSISLRKKIEAISDHYESVLRSIQQFPLNKGYTFDHYNLCYRLRNHDSHGLHFNNRESLFEELEDFQKNYKIYLVAPKKQILKLRDLILKTAY